ncbi:hypothetical protein GJ744_005685 [Endocarpon pusillum]|uniref:Uncharacterized protein n=1 Tax=Endocarpon pusillum TaxID=364733 RepID=A0A8H7A4H0_9EURO|nr:hypothetical protein GJ744_005685 [Endocarpon pusillum]
MIRDLRDNHQRRVEVTCFFEELPLPVVGRVVSKTSATFADHPVMSIYANHSEMVKFASVDDNGFKRLAGELVRWEQELSAHVNADGSVPQQLPGTVDPVSNVHWTVTRSVNNLFVGRGVVLTTIEKSIRHTLQDVQTLRQQRFVVTVPAAGRSCPRHGEGLPSRRTP